MTSNRRRRWAPWVVGALIAVVVVLYMGLWRGIWFDEFLSFAMGGMSFEYAVKTIDYTTFHVNHGQTGFYFLVDWGLLQVFGPSAWALRLPSVISALVMLLAAVAFIRAKGFGPFWQAIVVLTFAANEALMFYTGEARAYMPLAASAVAMLAYYALSRDHRRTWWAQLLAAFGFLVGSLMHPYWPILWFLIAAFSLAVWWFSPDSPRTPRGALGFLSPGWVIPSVILYVLIGQLTWMRRVLSFDWGDIYNWPALINAFLQDHFAFIPFLYPWRDHAHPVDVGQLIPGVLLALTVLAALWLVVDRRPRTRRLLPPLLLLLVALGSSLVASYLSYRQNYWIFPRQWVAGAALAGVALTWFFAEWSRTAQSQGSRVAAIPAYVFAALTTVAAILGLVTQLDTTINRYGTWQVVEQETRSYEDLVANPGEETFTYEPRQGYEYLADVNIARGGPFWDIFTAWYNSQAGMRPEFRETDDNWSDAIWPELSEEAYLCLPGREWECPAR